MSDLLKSAALVTGDPDTAHEVIRLTIEEMLAMTTSKYNQFYRFTERQFVHEASKRIGVDMASKLEPVKTVSDYDVLVSEMIKAKEKVFDCSELGNLTVDEINQVQAEHEAAAMAAAVLRLMKAMTAEELFRAFDQAEGIQQNEPYHNYTEGEKNTFVNMHENVVSYFAYKYGVEV